MLKRMIVPLLASASFFTTVTNAETFPLNLEQLPIAQHEIVLKPQKVDYSLPSLEYHWKAPSIHIKRNRSLERRMEKIGRPRFDYHADERVLWVPSIHEPAGFNPDWLYTDETVRAVERIAGRTASAVGGEYLKPVEDLFEWAEEWIDHLLKRAHLSYDSRDKENFKSETEKKKKRSSNGSYFKASAVIEFNQDRLFGFEGRWHSRLGKLQFELFQDQTTLEYRLARLLPTHGGELYIGVYNSFEYADRGVTLQLTIPLTALIGQEHSSQ